LNSFHGLPVESIRNPHLRLDYLTSLGPRIVGLFCDNQTLNLLAEVPDISWETPNGDYFLRGGHRLWTAPEDPIRTSAPDNLPPEIIKGDDFIILREPRNPYSGLSKSIKIRLAANRPTVFLEHRIENHTGLPVELAPWAITVLPLGGVAVLPFASSSRDLMERAPDRNLILWPYTWLSDPRLTIEDDFLLVEGKSQENECKIGYRNNAGWLGYANGSCFFSKRFIPDLTAPLPDMGCNIEVYVRDRFIELETLGPLVLLQPGEAITHHETWEVFQLDTVPKTAEDLKRAANQLMD
jgi:hypothetical protein